MFSFIFSGISLIEVNQIKSRVDQLAQSQQEIIHVMEESLTVIHMTGWEVQQNRVSIKNLIDVVSIIRIDFEMQLNNLERIVIPLRWFMLAYTQMEVYINEIKQTVNHCALLLEDLQVKVGQLALGRISPTVIPVDVLAVVLEEVEEKMPDSLALPHDPTTELWYYFKTLHCSSVMHNAKLIIIIEIPLLERSSLYNVYKVINLPVPLTDSNLSATYDLEFETFVVSQNEKVYTVLSPDDFLACKKPEKGLLSYVVSCI